MFQKDYWKMKDEELEALARGFNIPPISLADPRDTGTWYVDRPRIISQLLARDAAHQANTSLIISVISLAGTVAAILISLSSG